jgi:hypothetical protein
MKCPLISESSSIGWAFVRSSRSAQSRSTDYRRPHSRQGCSHNKPLPYIPFQKKLTIWVYPYRRDTRCFNSYFSTFTYRRYPKHAMWAKRTKIKISSLSTSLRSARLDTHSNANEVGNVNRLVISVYNLPWHSPYHRLLSYSANYSGTTQRRKWKQELTDILTLARVKTLPQAFLMIEHNSIHGWLRQHEATFPVPVVSSL